MLVKTVVVLLVSLFVFNGCARNDVPEYDGRDYNQIKRYDVGSVIDARAVTVSDNGTGKFLGAIIGAVVGSTIGGGDGRTLTSLGGGLLGGYAGKELGRANAKELVVKLDRGENVVVVVKGKDINIGDRVRIIKDGNKVAQVDKL
ncbi:MAG: glycine zipper 2TM domain-containing protein [Epsilonproteobacteria bacterium]|nr:glycine zipper 2TM domain-containing protein [Campylobacterota bacterium]